MFGLNYWYLNPNHPLSHLDSFQATNYRANHLIHDFIQDLMFSLLTNKVCHVLERNKKH